MKVETVIVGAGLSGLSCAVQLEKEKKDYLLVEKANRIGGRVGSIYEKDKIYDKQDRDIIFLEKDQTLIFVIPLLIILSFTTKGLSLYFAKV